MLFPLMVITRKLFPERDHGGVSDVKLYPVRWKCFAERRRGSKPRCCAVA